MIDDVELFTTIIGCDQCKDFSLADLNALARVGSGDAIAGFDFIRLNLLRCARLACCLPCAGRTDMRRFL